MANTGSNPVGATNAGGRRRPLGDPHDVSRKLDHDACVTCFGSHDPRVHTRPGCEGSRHLPITGTLVCHGKLRHYSIGRQAEPGHLK